MDFAEDPFKDYRYEDVFNIEDPFADDDTDERNSSSMDDIFTSPPRPTTTTTTGGRLFGYSFLVSFCFYNFVLALPPRA